MPYYRSNQCAFSLLELMVVISIMALLATVLLPSFSGVHHSVFKVRTKGQFNEYIFAYESFRDLYGFYPSMGSSSNSFSLNEENSVFIETLTGQGVDGSELLLEYSNLVNPRKITFLNFSESHFSFQDNKREIVDAFGNPNICIVIDRDLDGRIPLSEFGEMPSDAFESGAQFLYASIAIYSDNQSNNADWRWVYSWQ